MQLSFIDNGLARARRQDPTTSKAAADRVDEFARDHHARIVQALKLGPATIYDVSARTGIDHVAVARRMDELRKAGLAATTGEQRSGPTGRACRVWRAA